MTPRGISAVVLGLAALVLAGCASAPSGPMTPVVDSAEVVDGYLTVSGHVTGVAEDGGTCMYTFWSAGGGASRLTAKGTAAGDRTVCAEVSEQATMLLPGEYEVELTYESDSGTAKSERTPVTVPAR